jgi:predicted phosphodiesterase
LKLGIVSDVHGNLRGLEAVLADVEAVKPDLVVHGGDLVVNGPRPAEVVDRVRELGWPGILGNTDEILWQLPPRLPSPVRARFERRAAATRELIGPERTGWLRGLPPEWRQPGVALVHAVPGDLWKLLGKNTADAELRSVYGPLGEPLAVYCHIHEPYVRKLDGLTVANSGSAGAPYDGDTRPSWLLIADGRVQIRRVEYDVEAAAAELRASGYPDAEDLAKSLETATFHPPGMPGWVGKLARVARRL